MGQLIPIPFLQRLKHARVRLLPFAVLAVSLGGLAHLWRDSVATPTIAPRQEPFVANVNSREFGFVALVSVAPLQTVKLGDSLAEVVIADPRVLSTALEVIRSEIEMLRFGMEPMILQQQSETIDLSKLHLDWLGQRAQLASCRVSLQLAQSEEARVPRSELDAVRAHLEALRSQVRQLTDLVDQQAATLRERLASADSVISVTSRHPAVAAIAAQEAKLRLVEAELKPTVVRAPVGGVVTGLHCRTGETIVPGEPIVTIASPESPRVVAFWPAPVAERGSERETKMRAQVSTSLRPGGDLHWD